MTDQHLTMVAIPLDRINEMMNMLEQVVLVTSDEPQSMVNEVFNELWKWRGNNQTPKENRKWPKQ